MKKILDKHKKDILIFIIPFSIFFILFLAYYPGIIPYDGAYQWSQVESGLINNEHPFVSTYFMYLLSKIWNCPQVVIFFQVLIFSLFWTIMCNRLRNNTNFKKQIVYTFFISSLPIISIYSITLWKDILYSYYLMMLSFMTYWLVSVNNFQGKKNDYVFVGILLFLVFSYRHNGMLVAILYIIFIAFIYLKNNRKQLKNILYIFLSFTILFILFSFPKSYYLEKTSKSNSDEISLNTVDFYMTWMFGAFVDSNVISDEDLEFLNNIIEVDYWDSVYNGYLINTTYVPDEVNEDFLVNNSTEYHDMFLKYSLKYPDILLKHYIKADSLLFSVNSVDYGYVYSFPFSNWNYLSFRDITYSKLPLLEKLYTKIINVSFISPIKYFYQPALAMYASIIIIIYITKKYKYKNLYVILIPMILNTLSLMPVNLAQDLRYVYINYLILALVGLICLFVKKDGVVMNNNIESLVVKKRNLKILMIIPAYNEEKAILNTVNTIRNYNDEHNTHYDVLVINDGSIDKTGLICKKNNIKVINLIHNLGIGGAVQTGYKYAYEHNYDIAIQYDGDGQHDVNYVKDIIKPILDGEANFVIGSRFIEKDSSNFNSTFSRRIGIKLISFFMKLTCSQKIYDTTSGFRAADRLVISEFASNYPSEYPEPITTVELIKKGYKVSEVPVKMNERDGGVSSIRSWKNVYYMINVILSILVVGSRRYK